MLSSPGGLLQQIHLTGYFEELYQFRKNSTALTRHKLIGLSLTLSASQVLQLAILSWAYKSIKP